MPTKRPYPVTMACLYAGAGGVLALWDSTSWLLDWGSLSQQHTLRTYLDAASMRRSGLTVDDLLRVGKPLVTALMVCSVAAIVFAVYAMRAHNPSRIGLTVLGCAAFLGSWLILPYGFFVALMSVLTVGLLWTASARAWFRGDPDRPVNLGAAPSVSYAPQTRQDTPPWSTPPTPPAPSAPAHPESDRPEPHQPGQFPRPGQLPAYHHYGAPVVPVSGPRPDTMPAQVRRAIAVTGTMSFVAAVSLAIELAAMVAAPDQMKQTLSSNQWISSLVKSSGLSLDDYLRMIEVVLGVAFALALVGLVVSVVAAVWRRGGRAVLLVASAITAVASFALFPIGLPWLAAAIYVIVQVEKPASRAWFR